MRLRIAAALLAALGLARGLGGGLLLTQPRSALPPTAAAEPTLQALGLGLLLVALLAGVAAVQLARLRPVGPPLAWAALAAFLLGGLANGTLLFGRPTVGGTLGNLALAALVAAVLGSGRAGSDPGRR